MKTLTYWIQPNQAQHGLTVQEQNDRMDSALGQFELVCGLRFERTDNRSKARFKFQFFTEHQLNGAFGLHYSNNVIGINDNRKRKANLTSKDNWVVENLTIHEVGHSSLLRGAMDGTDDRYKHKADRSSVMSINLSAKWFSPDDVLGLQRRFGRPAITFYPRLKSIVGARVRRLTASWVDLRDRRNRETDKNKRASLTARVQKTLKALIVNVNEWRALKQSWQNVPMAG